MEEPILKKPTPSFDPRIYVNEVQSQIELFQKELHINEAEQRLLLERIRLMREFLSDLPATDPQYHTLVSQIEMDQIELEELKARRILLEEQISGT